MKKLSLLLGMVLLVGTASFACDGKKEACCKGKKEASAHQKKEECNKDKACCKKGDTKASASQTDMKKASKEAKTSSVEKKS